MKKPSLPFLVMLFITGALVHKGLAKKGSITFANQPVLTESAPISDISNKTLEKTAEISPLSFSIHKVVSSTVYYELHLQHNDTLKTWKVHQGLSCNPLQKRKAIQKEHLPLQYLLFEGTLLKEKGYKEGILVWDYGTYTLQDPSTEDVYSIIFDGKRVKGLYKLEKKHNDWILTKEDDAFANLYKNMTRFFTRSAWSGRTLTQILHGTKNQ